MAVASSRTQAFEALRSRDFRLLWLGQAVSLVGDVAFLTALGWRTFTLAGAGKLGIVLVCQATAMLATVLIGGLPAVRITDSCLCGAMAVVGEPTVLIGG